MRRDATGFGLAACLLWCGVIGVNRLVIAALGPLRAGAVTMSLAGGAGLALAAARGRLKSDLAGFSPAYLLACGGCFLAYQVCLLLAIGLAADAGQVIVVGMLNYLWPALTLALGVPLLGYGASAWLPLGLAATLAGEALVVGGGLPSRAGFTWVYLLAVLAALAWALYSNLARRLARGAAGNAVPLFMAVCGLVLWPLAVLSDGPPRWSGTVAAAVLFVALGPGLLAYSWWDRGMRQGRAKLLAVASYLIPLGSTAVTSLLWRAWPRPAVWLGAGLVLAGALVCRGAVRAADQDRA